MIRLDVNINLNTSAIQGKADAALKAAQMQLDQDVLKDSNYYIPKDTSELEHSGVRASKIGQGKIIWDTPYSRKLYYNPQYNFSKDRNPNARGLWFEFAKAVRMPNWLAKTKEKYHDHFK